MHLYQNRRVGIALGINNVRRAVNPHLEASSVHHNNVVLVPDNALRPLATKDFNLTASQSSRTDIGCKFLVLRNKFYHWT